MRNEVLWVSKPDECPFHTDQQTCLYEQRYYEPISCDHLPVFPVKCPLRKCVIEVKADIEEVLM